VNSGVRTFMTFLHDHGSRFRSCLFFLGVLLVFKRHNVGVRLPFFSCPGDQPRGFTYLLSSRVCFLI